VNAAAAVKINPDSRIAIGIAYCRQGSCNGFSLSYLKTSVVFRNLESSSLFQKTTRGAKGRVDIAEGSERRGLSYAQL
jgi:hypothetical protein